MRRGAVQHSAVHYRRATAGSSQDGAHPDNSTLHKGKIHSAPVLICIVVLLLLQQRRGAEGEDLGSTMKYLRQTTSGAAGTGLGTSIKYLRRTASSAAGNGLGTTLSYLRGAAGIGRA
jgi:hypothetical protein